VTDAEQLVDNMLGKAYPVGSIVGNEAGTSVFVASTTVSESGLESD